MRKGKISLFIVSVVLLLTIVIGCGSSNSNNDNNNTEIGSDSSFSGEVIGNFLKELAGGAGGAIGKDVVGNVLRLLGWGDPSNNVQEEMLKNIDNKLNLIAEEIQSLEADFKALIKEVISDIDTLKKDGEWPKNEIKDIFDATQTLDGLMYNKDGSTIGLSEGNQTNITAFADAWIGGSLDHGMNQVNGVYGTFNGSKSAEQEGILSVYVDQTMLNLVYDEEYLFQAYEGLESFTSQLLGYQVKAMHYTVDSYKAKEDNASAQQWFNCFYQKGGAESCNILYNEIGNIDKPYSFMSNAIRLILSDAPLYEPFLYPSAESILKRAEFYNLLVTGETKFGLHIFHISTADMTPSPDEIYVVDTDYTQYTCTASRHSVEGRKYDFWEGQSINFNTTYKVVDYSCGDVHNGTYNIFLTSNQTSSIGKVEVNQYDTGYDQNSSGSISYGFGLITNRIGNRFDESSSNWSMQKPKDDNYHSSVSGNANSWPIITKTTYNDATQHKSKARAELDGHFNYRGEHPATIEIHYHAGFYLQVKSTMADASADSSYHIGVYDATHSKKMVTEKSHHLIAGPGHEYKETKDVYGKMTFTAEPGHDYYIYFNIISKATNEDGGDDELPYSETNLNTVHHVFFLFP